MFLALDRRVHYFSSLYSLLWCFWPSTKICQRNLIHSYILGDRCEQETTLSLAANSLLIVNTSRSEGYDIYLRFKTTLPNGILVFGSGYYSYILELVNGRLNLHSSLLNKWEGVFIGSGLNNSKWHKVFVAINSTHLLLSANEETTIYPINSYDSGLSNVSYTSFPVTYLGGTIPHLSSYLRHLTHAPSSFVGCMQDVVINGQWIFPHETNANQSLINIQAGCPRQERKFHKKLFSLTIFSYFVLLLYRMFT